MGIGGGGEVVWLDMGAHIVAFERSDSICCIVNMGTQLPPNTAVWLT